MATGADMRMHREYRGRPRKQFSALTIFGYRLGFDARTFGVMSEMIENDAEVPLTFAPQVEYREQVTRALSFATPSHPLRIEADGC